MLKHFIYGTSFRNNRKRKKHHTFGRQLYDTCGANFIRSHVLHWAAQVSFRNDFMVRSAKDKVGNDAKQLQLNVRKSAPDTK